MYRHDVPPKQNKSYDVFRTSSLEAADNKGTAAPRMFYEKWFPEKCLDMAETLERL